VPPLNFCDPAVALPKLHVLAVNQSYGALLSFSLVSAMEVYATEDMAVRPNDVGAILLHVRTPDQWSGQTGNKEPAFNAQKPSLFRERNPRRVARLPNP
jgi:hypothetical protein